MRYFKKQNPKQALYGSYGQWIAFPDFGNGFGGIATEDPKVIREFTLAMKKSVGGISEVTEKEFEDLKKKPQSSPHSNAPLTLNGLLRMNNAAKGSDQQRGAVGGKTVEHPKRGGDLLMPPNAAKLNGFKPKSIASR